MKKVLSLLLCVVLLCTLFSGCGETGSGKVVVCFDIAYGGDYATADYQEAVTSFLGWVDDCHKYLNLGISSEDIEVEIIPGAEEEPAARATALQRIRSELMAGKGPDVFVCKTYSDYFTWGDEFDPMEGSRLFPYVEKIRDSGLFLPLEDLLSEFTVTNPDDLIPGVLEGGKDQNGEQVILPLAINVPIIMLSGLGYPECEFEGTSWEDVLRGDDPVLREMSVWPMSYWRATYYNDEMSYVRVGGHGSGLSYLFPQVADFKEERPYLTEEELFQTITASLDAYRRTLEQETDQNSASVYITDIKTNYGGDDWFCPAPANNPYTFVPLRNTEGGSTAIATAYCAVNAYTKQKEKARDVLDVLLSEANQKGGHLYWYFEGMPVNRNLGGMEFAVHRSGTTQFTGTQFRDWQRVCDDINMVRFLSPLDTELNAMMEEIEDTMYTYRNPYSDIIQRNGDFINYTISDEKLKAIISQHYRNMQRLLDES